MFKNKRGLSTVVTTLIIILLVLVAIGIIWVVIRGVIESGTQSADFAVKCLAVDIRATAISCSGINTCNVTLNRKAGGEAIDGVKLVFYNTTTSTNTGVIPVVGNIAPLTTSTTSAQTTTGADYPNKVEVTAYFKDSAGTEQLCTQPSSYTA